MTLKKFLITTLVMEFVASIIFPFIFHITSISNYIQYLILALGVIVILGVSVQIKYSGVAILAKNYGEPTHLMWSKMSLREKLLSILAITVLIVFFLWISFLR